MRRYLVEVYTPASTPLADVADRLRRAAAELSDSGTRVRYLHPIFVPDDETCFHLLDAVSSHAAAEVTRRAGVSPQRISEAVRDTTEREDRHDCV